MILEFKPQFKAPILNGTKIHTIRKDVENLFYYGLYLDLYTSEGHSKRIFHFAKCHSIQEIEIINKQVFIEGNLLSNAMMLTLAFNNGFNSLEEFFEWFNKIFVGKIIHFTDFKY